MAPSTIVAIFGLSGAGKSTLSNVLKERLDYKHIHCIGHIKRYYEKTYGMPPGALDTYEGKAFRVPGMTCTLGEMLEKLYHFWEDVDPVHSVRGLEGILCELIENKQNFSINAIRNAAEVIILKDMKERYPDIKILKVLLNSDQEVNKSTDHLQIKLYDVLPADKEIKFFNNYTDKAFDTLVNWVVESTNN